MPGFQTAEFKTPSLPFARSTEEGPRGSNNLNNAHTSPAADATNLNLFRPKSCRPPGESGAQARRHGPPPPPEPSFFGNAKFPFDPSSAGGSDLDDSGYFSEHTEAEADRFGPVKRNDTAHASNGANIDTRFVHSTKRVRPTSPGDDEDIVMQQSNRPRDSDLQKRPCVRRSPSRSHAPLSRTSSILESAPDERAPSFALPSHIPHPMAAMGELPGLEFSEADLARYAELYEQGSERWSKAPMEEWVAGADEVLAKFGEMIDMVSLSPALCSWTFRSHLFSQIKDHMRCVVRFHVSRSSSILSLLTRSECPFGTYGSCQLQDEFVQVLA